MENEKVEDVIIIHSMRPKNLFGQIKSFVDNQAEFVLEGRKALIENMSRSEDIRKQIFLIISDNDDTSAVKDYNKEVEKTKGYIEKKGLGDKIRIDYWSFDRQNAFFDFVFSEFPEAKKTKVLLSDYNSKKFGGLRGAQNKGIIIADYISKDLGDNIIYHKLDDDIYSYLASFKGGVLSFVQGYNVFGHKAALLDMKGIRIIGSVYLIDSPSPLTDLKEGLDEILKLLEGINDAQEGKIKDFLDYMSMIPDRIVDESGIIKKEGLFLKRGSSLEEVDELLSLLQKGKNRFWFQTIEGLSKNFFRFIDTLPGGFISFKKREKIFPFFNGSNQDVIFSVLEHAREGGVHLDLPAGHIKSVSVRESLLDSMKIGDDFGEKNNDFHTMNYILELAKKDRFKIGEGLPNNGFYGWRFHKLKPESSLDTAEKILELAKKINKNNTVKNISRFALSVKSNMEEMSKSFDYDKREVPESKKVAEFLYDTWKDSIKSFNNLREYVSSLKKDL